jgi:hypothetical protein
MKPPLDVTGDDLLFVVGGAALWQRSKPGPLQLDPLAVVGIPPTDDFIDEAAVGIEIVEVTAAAQQQRVFERLLEMAMRTPDGPVLMRDAGVVAGWPHAVMAAERLVALRQILLRVGIEIAEGGRQAIAAMLLGNAAERPQRILQALGQRDEALAAQDNVSMLETRECQSEVIEPMRQRDAGNRDAERARVGEVGQAKTARRVLLPEDDILFRAGQCPPTSHPPFQRAPDAGTDLGVAPPHLFENRNGADAGSCLQDRDDLAIPNIGKRVGSSPATRRLLLGWQARIILDPVAGRCADAGFGGSNGSVVGLSETHVQPHLVVGDVEAGQSLIPQS